VDWGALADSSVDLLTLLIVCWVVVSGGIGAALGARFGRPVLGFVFALVPLPIFSWLLVLAIVRSPQIVGDDEEDPFARLLDDET
jgi:hypothetical protein